MQNSEYGHTSHINPQLQQSAHLSITDSGGATPMPTEHYSTPAWDPSSRTPAWNPSFQTSSIDVPDTVSELNEERSSVAGPSSVQNEHCLLNPLLCGLKLNATVDGGEHKNKQLEVIITSTVSTEERVRLEYIKYGTPYFLQPQWVTPKHPSPTHDNGLLVVIKGDHCRKYVRRIHHRHSDTGTTMIVAVVNRNEGSVDTLTDEHLELHPDFLCTVKETKDEKNLNKNLMTSLRTTYRKNC